MAAHNVEDIYTLTPVQQGLLFHVLADPTSEMYIEQGVSTLRGEIDDAAFERAWGRVLERHTALRTSFLWKDLSKPVQVVYKQLETPLVRHDWRGLSEGEQAARLEDGVKSDRSRCSRLSEPPLVALTLARVADDAYKFIWSAHHLIHDAWSLSVIFEEFFTFYEAEQRGAGVEAKPVPRFKDYVTWLKRQELAEAEAFWRRALGGFTETTPLPGGKARGAKVRGDKATYGREERYLPVEKTAAVQALSRRHQLTVSTLMHGALSLLLSFYGGREEVVFGTVMSGRPASLRGAESMVGVFINTLPFRVPVPPGDTLLDWLKGVQDAHLRLRQYEHTPLALVHDWSDVPRNVPLFENILVIQNAFAGLSGAEAGGLKVVKVEAIGHPNYPFMLRVTPGDSLWLEVLYDRRRLNPSEMNVVLRHLELLLDSLAAEPDATLGPLLSRLEGAEKEREEEELARRRNSIGQRLGRAKPRAIKVTG